MNGTAITRRTARRVFAVSFVLNLVWENVQAPLYHPYRSFWSHLPACLLGTLGDASFTTLLYLGLVRARRDPQWFTRPSRSTWTVAAIVGLLVAVVTEVIAVRREFWAYGPRMPRLPLLNAGVTPLVQLALLSIMTFKLLHLTGLVDDLGACHGSQAAEQKRPKARGTAAARKR
ncbi:hypothetical protein [Deinococcus peraridilitoris]|uniref:Uncharacterized protein n=1 Tax=Deinococcus peraridilitoris (strain DSM 19664 / LMG 22246 / CIP 109416 / KR-200) TaxID=937777 RepID=L0A768_DEIPD|nr:hypothetical protein [Deinococcus peraridilitoris]AFZ69294.1 hypothetical protein Deipe_3879 [Deinococcus peraridilitoris DSM 19664]